MWPAQRQDHTIPPWISDTDFSRHCVALSDARMPYIAPTSNTHATLHGSRLGALIQSPPHHCTSSQWMLMSGSLAKPRTLSCQILTVFDLMCWLSSLRSIPLVLVLATQMAYKVPDSSSTSVGGLASLSPSRELHILGPPLPSCLLG